MHGLLNATVQELAEHLRLLGNNPMQLPLLLPPILIFLELPYYLLLVVGAIRHVLRRTLQIEPEHPYRPRVSCLITCYSEGDAVAQTLHTLCEQTYDGMIEIIPIIDGALQNDATYQAARRFIRQHAKDYPKRRIILVPKWQRGGRVSSLNAGLSMSRGEIVMALDGDTSFDNDMVQQAVRHFADPRVSAVSGALAVRNANQSLVTRMQTIEYRLSLLLAKIGLSEFNVLNNVSGAFGVFRRSVLITVGGWNTGSAEDLDMTTRLKHYTVRNQHRIVFEPLAVGHTDVPVTWKQFLMQRLRWDGDLIFIYLRKHWQSFQPRLIGWPNFILLIWSGLLFQLVAPFVIATYLAWQAFVMTTPAFLATNVLIYLYYLGIALVLYICFLVVGSRQPLHDLRGLLLIPAFACFVFITRIWSIIAIMNELWRYGHEESNMAPWWVLKKRTKS